MPFFARLQVGQVHLGGFVKVQRVQAQHVIGARAGCDDRVKAERGGHAEAAAVVSVLTQQVHAARSLVDSTWRCSGLLLVVLYDGVDSCFHGHTWTSLATRIISAAFSGVISRWGIPNISKPTINLRISAERRSGG